MRELLPTRLRPLLLICALAVIVPAARADHAVERAARRPGVAPQMFSIDDQNPAMRQAVAQARRTVPKFLKALQAPRPGQELFAVKKPVFQKGKVEHLWLTSVTFAGNRFHGRVDNRPHEITGLSAGARVSVNPDEISDWAYVDHGRLIGGYSIRALYQQLTPARRQELQNEVVFKIAGR